MVGADLAEFIVQRLVKGTHASIDARIEFR